MPGLNHISVHFFFQHEEDSFSVSFIRPHLQPAFATNFHLLKMKETKESPKYAIKTFLINIWAMVTS